MVVLKTLEGPQVTPVAYSGNVRVCRDAKIIMEVVGKATYWELEMLAAEALEPECPELALLIPVLSFNTMERAKLTFYKTLELGDLKDDATPDLLNWGKKLPEDGGAIYRKTAQLMKWS